MEVKTGQQIGKVMLLQVMDRGAIDVWYMGVIDCKLTNSAKGTKLEITGIDGSVHIISAAGDASRFEIQFENVIFNPKGELDQDARVNSITPGFEVLFKHSPGRLTVAIPKEYSVS